MTKVVTLFGTRPEAIKLAPIICELQARPLAFHTISVASGQHADLVHPFVDLFGIRIDHDLHVMERDQTPSEVCARILAGLDPLLAREQPDLILVQGDTTTALAGALAAFHRHIPVGHVEAGLRSGDPASPFPEEMNRRLITRLATWHFAATPRNRRTLLAEGVPAESVFVTGNPVVDALRTILSRTAGGPRVRGIVGATRGLKRVVLTMHRRESFSRRMAESLKVLRGFVERHPQVALLLPVHPNPVVVETTRELLSGHERIHLLDPLGYEDFIFLLSSAWLIVSDSGGVQEEAPSLGKPLLILRDNTERPESIEAGIARLVGPSPGNLLALLEQALGAGSWAERAGVVENPFGRGDAGPRVVEILAQCARRPVIEPVSEASRR